MRITDKIIYKRMFTSLQKAKERLSESQQRIATQKRITKSSDDPVEYMRIMAYRRDLSRLRQTARNAGNVHDLLLQTDGILEKVGNTLQEARTMATSAANDTMDPEARTALADQVQIMIEDTLQSANTKIAGRYIFAGHKTLTQPFTETDGEIDYVGDDGETRQRIELSGTMVINVPGDTIFGTSNSGLFKTLQDLKTALQDNDVNAVQGTLGALDTQINNIAAIRSKIGAKINRAEASTDELNAIELSLTSLLSKTEDTDMALSSAEYLTDQTTYEAAVQTTASILHLPNLIDFLS